MYLWSQKSVTDDYCSLKLASWGILYSIVVLSSSQEPSGMSDSTMMLMLSLFYLRVCRVGEWSKKLATASRWPNYNCLGDERRKGPWYLTVSMLYSMFCGLLIRNALYIITINYVNFLRCCGGATWISSCDVCCSVLLYLLRSQFI